MKETEEILAFLDRSGVSYEKFLHEECNTIREKAELDSRFGIKAKHCKNIFLTDRKQRVFFLLVIPFEKTFRTAEVSKQLGTSRLSFASEELLMEKLRCRSGHLSSLCLLYDREEEIKLVLDRDLMREEALCFHPAENTVTLTLSTQSFVSELCPKLFHTPVFVTVSTPIP